MPFGVKNAPAVFARLVADIMNGLQWSEIALNQDDIIIGSNNFQEHYDLLKKVLERLRWTVLIGFRTPFHLTQITRAFMGWEMRVIPEVAMPVGYKNLKNLVLLSGIDQVPQTPMWIRCPVYQPSTHCLVMPR